MKRFLVAAAFLACASMANAGSAYNVFPTAVTGSARDVGLGGAVVSDPDGYEAVFINPAGISGLTGTGIDFGSDSNSVDNFVVDLNDPKARSLNVPIKYSYVGLRYVTDSGWGLGFAAQTPFNIDDVFNGTTRAVRRKGTVFVPTGDVNEVLTQADTYTLAAGKSFFNGKLGVGAALNYTSVNSQYTFTPVVSSLAPFSRTVNGDAFAGDVGLLAEPAKWVRFGMTYKMGYRVPFNDSNNSGLPVAFTAFRDVKTPDRFLFGLRLSPRDDLRLFAQARLIAGMRDTFVSGSDVFPGTTGATVESGRSTVLTGAWGLEYIAYDSDDFGAKLWAGGYLEDANIQGGYTRYHRTAGFSLTPWFLSFNMAIDQAELYNNFVVGLGVDLLQVGKRLSKTYGWNLPL